jgi:hypothetical protein
MTQLTRYCAGCSEDRPFGQLHADPGGCPDVPDGDCPEWGCLVCGDAFLIGVPAQEPASTARTVRAALSGARPPGRYALPGSRPSLNRVPAVRGGNRTGHLA